MENFSPILQPLPKSRHMSFTPSTRIKRLGYKVLYTFLYQAHQVYCRIRHPEVFGSYVLCMHNARVLLIKNSYKRYWTLPCGGIASGETPTEAAIREAREEVGLELATEDLLLRAKIIFEGENQKDHIHLFACNLSTKPAISIDHKEVESYAWVSKEELSSYTILTPIKPYIEAELAEQ